MLNESDLEPLFSSIGPIYEMLLHLTPAGAFTGVAFVRFTREDHARTAISVLHRYEILPGEFINVDVSEDNRTLWLGNVPEILSTAVLDEAFRTNFGGVREVATPRHPDGAVSTILIT
jgi:RNA recognition motif-containing protein